MKPKTKQERMQIDTTHNSPVRETIRHMEEELAARKMKTEHNNDSNTDRGGRSCRRISTTASASASASALSSNVNTRNSLRSSSSSSKRLSTIPLESLAPMSPLDHAKGLTSTKKKSSESKSTTSSNQRSSYSTSRSAKLTAISCKSLDEVEIRQSSSRRKSSITSYDHDGRAAIVSPRSSSLSTMRTTQNSLSSRTQSQNSLSSSSFTNQQRTIRPTSSRSAQRRSLSATSPMRHITRSNANVSSPSSLSRLCDQLSQSIYSQEHSDVASSSFFPVLVHGRPKDTSWLELVDQLRAENADDYENASEKENVEEYMEEDDMRIRVVIRKRPLSSKEVSKSEVDVLQPVRQTQRIFVYQPRVRVDLAKEVAMQKFAFDNVFDEYAGNSIIYEETIKDLVPNVFDGNWSSVFAYGQTGKCFFIPFVNYF